jgi:hypothetical protein
LWKWTIEDSQLFEAYVVAVRLRRCERSDILVQGAAVRNLGRLWLIPARDPHWLEDAMILVTVSTSPLLDLSGEGYT